MSAFKIGMLLVRTLAKPVTGALKRQAKENETFKQICIRIAQGMHRTEVKLRTGALNESVSAREVRPLNEAKAIDAGADFLAEAVTFGIAASILLFEQYRSRRDARNRKEYVDVSLSTLGESQQRLAGLADDVQAIKAALDSMRETNLLIAEGLGRLTAAEQQAEATNRRLDGVLGLRDLFGAEAAPQQLVVNLEPGRPPAGSAAPGDTPLFLSRLNARLGLGSAHAGGLPPITEESVALSQVVG
ncbi:optic atrophy 3 protein-domain-containing protein [Hyaloraphidium curvatum]|nr:optic atrophy 3 protein-domain-containing protein [Hyaloraphidium curvatum]